MNNLLRDLRFSLRLLAKTPGFTATAIAVLALGIGVNTAIFSIVHELAFSPRPWPAEKQVVQLYTQDEKNPQKFRLFSYPVYQQLLQQQTGFTDIMAHNLAFIGVGDGDSVRRTFGAIVSANYFSTLQVRLIRGRDFLPAEEKPGAAAQVTIVSYNFWKRLGSPADMVGRVIRVNERPFTVIGIAPEGFSGTMMLFGPELYFPLGCDGPHLLTGDSPPGQKNRLNGDDVYSLVLVGRLKPGQTIASVGPGLSLLAAQLKAGHPVNFKDQRLLARPLPRLAVGDAPNEERWLSTLGVTFLGMAGIVLLIACLNLANMLLARGAARRKEFAIRLAVGGGRARLVRQLLTEGFVLALAGGLAGFLLGAWSTSLLMRAVGAMLPVGLFFQGTTNPALYAATFAFCALGTVLFALGPALKLSRGDVIRYLKEQAGEDAVRPRRWHWLPRYPLVVVQLTLSLGLLISAGLFIRGALAAARVKTGFRADDTILVELDASLGGYDQTRCLQLYRAASDRIAALPGVQSASIASLVPFGMSSAGRPVQRGGIRLAPDARPSSTAEGLAIQARWNSVGAEYFATTGLPLLRGRAFTRAEAESPGAPAVAIIDDLLAKKLWPEDDTLGRRIQFAGNAATMEVVGIVPATRWQLFENPGGCIFVPYAQGWQSDVFLHVRTAPRAPGADAALFDTIRREIRLAAPGVPLLATKTYRQHLDASFQLWIVRVAAVMFSVFGGLALILAVVGVYGVKAYAVARRTREIGIRMALGAEPGAVLGMILREGLIMTLSGTALGFLFALGLGRVIGSMLYQVSPVDPVAFTLAPLVLTGAALLACYLPARRATKVNPMIALRAE